jgi:hypothetical protein
MLTGAAAGMADGGVSGGLSYLTSGQPLSVNGFVEATTNGAAFGGATGGLGGAALTKVSGSACFVAGTQVLMGDGSSRNIEDVKIGDEVTAADPETGETHARRVIDTYVHKDVPTYDVHTTDGVVTSTEEHPFYVEGRGWTPVRDLQPGDRLVNPKGEPVSVLGVRETGRTQTVYNFNVEELHSYHVGVEDAWLLVHNECGRGIDLRGRDPMDIVPDNASVRELTPHPNGGSQYGLEFKWVDESGVTMRMRIHGPDGTAPPGSNSASGETYRVQHGARYQDEAGNLYHKNVHNPNSPHYNPDAANATHIPWPSEYPGL